MQIPIKIRCRNQLLCIVAGNLNGCQNIGCMVQRNKISDKATVGKIYDVYKAWCQDNNSGYAKSAKEFRNIISEYLNTSYSNLTVRSKAGIIYRNYTLSVDTKQQYCRIYGFDEILW